MKVIFARTKRLSSLIGPHFVFIFAILLLSRSGADAQVNFPLRLSDNHRFLVDDRRIPFLIKEISAWGLIQVLSEPEAAAYMDSVKQKGFNTLLVSIISFDERFAGGPPNWQGIAPFHVKWDFSSYNTDYFDHVDRVLQMAKSRGILVLLVACYLGWPGDGKQGWWDELLDSKNDTAKSGLYGQFLGKRYRDFSNIVWVAGGDNDGVAPLFDHMNNIIIGIKHFDPSHLWTGHFNPKTVWSTQNPLYGSYIDLDGLYIFLEANSLGGKPQYQTELVQYVKGKMIFQLDQAYEQDFTHTPENDDPQWIRRKNYEGLVSGCAGTSFSPATSSNQGYLFANWRPLMNTEGMQEAKFCFRAFGSRAWSKLVPVPDNHTAFGSGRGAFGGIDYVCAAITTDSATLMAYLPSRRAVSIDLSHISGKKAKAWWYSPLNGQAVLIGTFDTRGMQNFTPDSEGDWLLVIDNAGLELGPPGL